MQPCLCRHGTISICDSFCSPALSAWLAAGRLGGGFRSVGFLPHTGLHTRSLPPPFNLSGLGPRERSQYHTAQAAVAASGQANPHGSARRRRNFLVCETQRQTSQSRSPAAVSHIGERTRQEKNWHQRHRILYHPNVRMSCKICRAPFASGPRGFPPQAEIDVKSFPAVAQSLVSFFGALVTDNQALSLPGLRCH